MALDSEPVSQNNPAKHTQGAADQETHDGKSKMTPAGGAPGTPPAETHCKITCQTEKDWWDKFKKWPEILGVIALVVYTAYTIKMYHATKLAAEAAHDSAVAAQSAANTASSTLANQKTTFQIEQRPYIVADIPQFLGPLTPNAPIKANLTFKNIGKTPATNVVWNVALAKFYAKPLQEKLSREKLIKFLASQYQMLNDKNSKAWKELATYPAEFSPRHDLAPEATSFTTNPDNPTLSSDEIPIVQRDDSNISLFYMAVINYSDSYRSSYRTQACYMFWGKDQKTWHICDSHSTIE
jgi:hypothetical protein